MSEIVPEEWRPLSDFPGYDVSNLGNVRTYMKRGRAALEGRFRQEPQLLRPALLDNDGLYYQVSLSVSGRGRKSVGVHRLVAAAFLGPCPPGHVVRHLDGDGLNNHVSNLAYGSELENARDRKRHRGTPGHEKRRLDRLSEHRATHPRQPRRPRRVDPRSGRLRGLGQFRRYPGETFRCVPGYPGYEVSNIGRVRSYWKRVTDRGRWGGFLDKPRLLHPILVHVKSTSKYYRAIGLLDINRSAGYKREFVHGLVASAFLGPLPRGQLVRHLDGDGLNNRVKNLAYGTHKDNAEDARRHGTLCEGEAHPHSKLTRSDVLAIRSLLLTGASDRGIAEKFGISPIYVGELKRAKTWSRICKPMVIPSRRLRGVGHHNAKLTDQIVRDIRRRLANDETSVGLGVAYGVHPAVITAIRRGKTWAHVEAEGAAPQVGARKGQRHPNAKLTNDQARDIRDRLSQGKRLEELAAEFGVSVGTIYAIESGRLWAHLGPPPHEPNAPSRRRRGKGHPNTKLTDEMVREIKCLIAAGVKGVDIAARFGLTPTTVCDIKRGRVWGHVTLEDPNEPKPVPSGPDQPLFEFFK